jgi:pumilio family protein 6
VRLLLHRDASRVLADAFELHANAYERALLLRDFYGKEAALASSFTAGSVQDRERTRMGLAGVLEGTDERRRRILRAVRENLDAMCVRALAPTCLLTVRHRFNNPDKGAITHAIVHRALLEYILALEIVSDETEREKLHREIYERCACARTCIYAYN